VNVRVSDLYNDFKELQIREETANTFGRRIKENSQLERIERLLEIALRNTSRKN
jgi:hypothetical protein